MRERLASLGRTIGDAEYTSVLIGSLPTSYDSAINSLINSYDATDRDLTSTAVIRVATNKQEKRQLCKSDDKKQEEAFAIEDHQSKRKNIECYNCHKKGHYKSQCYVKGSGQEGKWPGRSRKDNDKSKYTRDGANVAAKESREDD